ncbi:2-keto-4-pentenoate hydratase [Qipengyuania seohaensis]|uniref:2-keto-4-pentenoate hydratase n=1 Tax=Qipengyuania seohaensis TaxID=266951 RepID=UPI000C21F57C|nr:2-keto-4-pentenoate hydratase [Qipengyuania seohaensis]
MTNPALQAEDRDTSAILTRARLEASALPGPPPGLPDNLDAAYAIQHKSIAAWPDKVAGWKVGGVPADYVERFQETRLAGPIFGRSVVHHVPGQRALMSVFCGGFAAIEPEFIIRLGEDRTGDRLFIGAEIASSPIPAINDHGPVAVISDFGNNNGLLVGPEVPDWRDYAGEVRVVAEIDGTAVAERMVANPAEDVDAALQFLIELAHRKGFSLPAGTYVSSGAITGVHEAAIGCTSRLDFGQLGELHLELVEAKPFA